VKEVITLLKPRFWSFRNGGDSEGGRGRILRLLVLGLLGLVFWGGIFFVFYRVLSHFQRSEGFGDVLAFKLLSMSLITFFSLLLFSGILTSLSKLYLSKDLLLVHSMPASREKIFFTRWIESTLDSSWMVLVYSLPVFLSYGIVYKAGAFFYAMAALGLLPFCVIASSLSALIVMTVALILPAGRVRSAFFFFTFLVFLVLATAFRLMRPERFANPEAFATVALYLESLEAPNSPLLPTTWFYDTLRAALSGEQREAFFHAALSWSGALTIVFVVTWISGVIYFPGFSRAQTVAGRLFRCLGSKRRSVPFALGFLSGPARAFASKEIKTFLRDKTQWSQIFLVAALIVIYLYNFAVLPFGDNPIRVGYLQNLVSFLNMGLAAFVLSAVSARFVFPAVSMEGEAFWIVKSAPVSIRTFLRVKFLIYLFPLLLLSEVLIVATNLLLQVTPFMMVLSVVTMLFIVPGIVSMGIGLGAVYPNFKSENPTQSVTSLGGLIYMTLCVGFIAAVVVLEAGPVYQIFISGFRRAGPTAAQWLRLAGSFGLVAALSLAAVWFPLRLGEKKILERELGRSSFPVKS
jgi:ABC-2 type transport system permease protein